MISSFNSQLDGKSQNHLKMILQNPSFNDIALLHENLQIILSTSFVNIGNLQNNRRFNTATKRNISPLKLVLNCPRQVISFGPI